MSMEFMPDWEPCGTASDPLLQRQPQLAGVVAADVAASLQQRRRPPQSLLAFVAAWISEVPETNLLTRFTQS